MTRDLDSAQLERLAKEFDADPANRLLQNALTRTKVDEVALDHRVAVSLERSVSHQLDDWAVTNQKKSGRCWMFAGLNLLRVGAAAKLGVKDFEFSQSFVQFWDRLEKANFWLEEVLATVASDVDDRKVAHLMRTPAEDGGQWNMFVAVVRKYGLVPKSAMPETFSSSNTGPLNRDLSAVLRQAGRDLRTYAARGLSEDDLLRRKSEALAVVHRMLSLHLGTPPDRFLWQWRDDEKNFHRDGVLTPLEFADRYISLPLDDYVCIVHDPRESSPVGRTYTVEALGNVVGAPAVTYLNVEIDLIKRLAMNSIMNGEPVWFGCDVAQMYEAEQGVWDASLYDYDSLYRHATDLDKADRLLHQATAMTHAMLLTGVDVVDGEPVRWRVENSWGDEKADKGFWTMNDTWFAEHVFETAVRRDALPPELQAQLDTEPIVLPAWDPMGALAL